MHKFNVLIEGESLVFNVDARVSGLVTVSNFKTLVHKARELGDISRDSQKLLLSKVDIDLRPYLLDQEPLRHLKAEDGELLQPWVKISHFWPDPPLEGHLHIIVKLPATEIPPKRPLSEESNLKRLKRSRLATLAPSIIAQPSEYRVLQTHPSEKILDDRPQQDEDIPPIPLIYDGFGSFLDVYLGRLDPTDSDVDLTQLQTHVDTFADCMCRFYDSEENRRDAALPLLNTILATWSGNTTKVPGLQAAAIGSARTHGHNIGPHGAVCTVTEFQNWPANNNGIPQVELVGYVARSHASFLNVELLGRWRIPTLGLTIVGSQVRFYGIVLLGHQYRSVALTPGLSCSSASTDGEDRMALYRAFAAASILQTRIFQDAQRFTTTLPARIPNGTYHFPSITKLPKWKATGFLDFQIKAFHGDRLPSRLLYTATITDSKSVTILVKFVRTYSIDLHEFCAERGRAPKILGFEALPGGWYAIAMEFVPSTVPITASTEIAVPGEKWTKELLELVEAFHGQGYVHGDLRDANIMICAEGNVMLIDFDWAGKEGQASYPHLRLNPELLNGRASKGMKITKDDDKRILINTLHKLGDM